jgi:hypothetical protein
VLGVIKRELRRLSPDVKINTDQIRCVLEQEVLKREVVEGDKADEARKRITRAANRELRSKSEKDVEAKQSAAETITTVPPMQTTTQAPTRPSNLA